MGKWDVSVGSVARGWAIGGWMEDAVEFPMAKVETLVTKGREGRVVALFLSDSASSTSFFSLHTICLPSSISC